jgi:hypothetical protein
MSKRNNKVKSNLEIIRSIRGDWDSISPVTKVIPDKRRKPPKHKARAYDD